MEGWQNQSDRLMEKLQMIDRVYEEYAKSKGLTYISLTVLEAIVEAQAHCTQKLICERTHYPKQSVNLIVKAFMESGYVELRELSNDRRNKRICLTEAGQEFAEAVVGVLWRAERAAMERLGEQQGELLLRLIDVYGQTYCDSITKPGDA